MQVRVFRGARKMYVCPVHSTGEPQVCLTHIFMCGFSVLKGTVA
jgi:hypothetical protein